MGHLANRRVIHWWNCEHVRIRACLVVVSRAINVRRCCFHLQDSVGRYLYDPNIPAVPYSPHKNVYGVAVWHGSIHSHRLAY